jgi:hypothetical protein
MYRLRRSVAEPEVADELYGFVLHGLRLLGKTATVAKLVPAPFRQSFAPGVEKTSSVVKDLDTASRSSAEMSPYLKSTSLEPDRQILIPNRIPSYTAAWMFRLATASPMRSSVNVAAASFTGNTSPPPISRS